MFHCITLAYNNGKHAVNIEQNNITMKTNTSVASVASVASVPSVVSVPSHTPGPWNVGDDSPNEYEGPTIENIDTVIAVIPIDDVNDSTPEERANARIIAAAPELLSVLQSITAGVIEGLNSEGDYMHARVKEARAAIAKATGGQPGSWHSFIGEPECPLRRDLAFEVLP